MLLVCCAGIAVNRQATSAMALGAALLVLGALRLRARRLAGAAALAVLLGATMAAVPALRAPTFGAVADVATYQRLTTDRLGAWAAALEMARMHPLTGVGPGRFAAQAQTHRFAAEIRLGTRLPPPSTATGFAHAHQDYLQLAAEAGWPALALALLAFAAVWAPLLRLAQSPGAVEPLLLLAVLSAGAVAALAWFPLQIPCTAVLLLLACGRAWRLVARGPQAAAATRDAAPHASIALRVVATGLVLALLWPQSGRYRAEWQIAAASAQLEAVLRGRERGSAANAAVAEAERLARAAAAATDDNRAALLLGIALILQQRGDDASRVLERAIARGERAELTLNLGRARTVLGDSAGADAAYLRTAWASPLALATLPATMRADLSARVARLESQLRAGRLQAPPPLR
nr:O-antigen ligase family protein [Chiayiivirga flava]